MSQTELEAEINDLNAMTAAEVRKPNTPMSVYLLDANRLLATLTDNAEVRAELLGAGMEVNGQELTEETLVPMLRSRLGASRHTQARWDAVRSTRKPEELKRQEDEAYALRSELVAAGRWNLRRDRIAQGTLDAIQEGDGLADLILDLDALAVLILNHEAVFARDTHFDAKAMAVTAQQTAQALRAAATDPAGVNRAAALDLRNRAWTHLDRLTSEIRACARYVFRKAPARLTYFQLSYRS